MNLIDTNGVSYIFDRQISLTEDYYLVPDVIEEVELAQLVHSQSIPVGISEIVVIDEFDEVLYLNHYKRMLNIHGGRSFFNMTGFGDISILATIHTVLDMFTIQKIERLFDPTEQIVVFTDDSRLTRRVNTEFTGKNVEVKPVTDIK
ncbi:MAG: hypothetical protein R3B60_00985 [Candidatus Paceibacterota bacterium]